MLQLGSPPPSQAAAAVENGVTCPSSLPDGLQGSEAGFDQFINESIYFNADPLTGHKCELIPTFDFEKLWYVAAVATEAGHTIRVEANDAIIFTTEDCSSWGLYSLINFVDLSNLRFVDVTVGAYFDLDKYCLGESGNCTRFRVCQLTQDSNPLSYLSNPTQLLKGDLIIGFDDSNSQDSDYDDFIVALRAVNTKANPRFVIERGTSKDVFEGEGFCFVWTDSLTCAANVYKCGPAEVCDPSATNTCIIEDEAHVIPPSPISDITDPDPERQPRLRCFFWA